MNDGGTDEPSSSVPRFGPGREFDLIRSFFATSGSAPVHGVRIGPGDDCAVVSGESLAIGTDLSVETIHFRREWISAEEIGFRAACAALSDLAAMAARPIGVLASVAAAPDDVDRFLGEVMAGVTRASESIGASLIGGDLTRSPGPLVLDIVVVGEAAAPVRRSGAMPGDVIWVTGTLGAAALAVEAFRAGRTPSPEAYHRFVRPSPRVRESLWLVERSLPKAMLDLSDGLAGDVQHLAAASGVAIVLEAERIPIHPVVLSSASSPDDAFGLGIAGGEDYELCFAARPTAVEPFTTEFMDRFGTSLQRIGRVEAGLGAFVEESDGKRRPLGEWRGFQHFGGSV